MEIVQNLLLAKHDERRGRKFAKIGFVGACVGYCPEPEWKVRISTLNFCIGSRAFEEAGPGPSFDLVLRGTSAWDQLRLKAQWLLLACMVGKMVKGSAGNASQVVVHQSCVRRIIQLCEILQPNRGVLGLFWATFAVPVIVE